MSAGRVSLSPRVRCRAVGQDGVAVHIDQGRVAVVNEVGLFILRQLASPRSPAELAIAMATEFQVDPDSARRDLAHFLREMESEALILWERPAREAGGV